MLKKIAMSSFIATISILNLNTISFAENTNRNQPTHPLAQQQPILYVIDTDMLDIVDDHILYIPANLESIPKSLLNKPNIDQIVVHPANPLWSSKDGVLYNKNKTILYRYPSNKHSGPNGFVVPASVNLLHDNAFMDCMLIQIVDCSKCSNLKIGHYAFYNMDMLKDIIFPPSGTKYFNDSFCELPSLGL